VKVAVAWTATVLALASMQAPAAAEAAQPANPEQIRLGADIYARNCSPCHGPRMLDPEGAFDLRKFPRDQRDRFITSVTRGKGTMPPWGDLFKPHEIDALWAYVRSGGSE
jgi:mono/diheme cytochrome c family protein